MEDELRSEGLLVQAAEYRVEGLQDSERSRRIRRCLAGIQGVVSWDIEPHRLQVRYYPHLISPALIRGEIEKVVRLVEPGGRRPGFLRRFIDRLAASNDQTFGSSTLECCKLNRGKKSH